jgi:hypothetical protein
MNNIYFLVSEAIKGFSYEFSVLKKLLRNKIRFVIAGGYAMRKYRQIHDLDISVHPDDWKKLRVLVSGTDNIASGSGDPKYDVGKIEFFYTWYPRGFAYLDLEKEGFDVDENGFPCWSVDQTIRWKKKFGRPKDLQDIQILKKS